VEVLIDKIAQRIAWLNGRSGFGKTRIDRDQGGPVQKEEDEIGCESRRPRLHQPGWRSPWQHRRAALTRVGLDRSCAAFPPLSMSLKTFHLIFITASIILAFGCGAWWLKEFLSDPASLAGLFSGVLSIAFGVGLIFYERFAAHKFNTVAILK
jgi:hypothetical protein